MNAVLLLLARPPLPSLLAFFDFPIEHVPLALYSTCRYTTTPFFFYSAANSTRANTTNNTGSVKAGGRISSGRLLLGQPGPAQEPRRREPARSSARIPLQSVSLLPHSLGQGPGPLALYHHHQQT